MITKQLIEKLDFSVTSTEKKTDDMLAVDATKKGLTVAEKAKTIIYVIRTNEAVNLDVLKELQVDLEKKNTRKGMIITTSVFTPSVIEECKSTSILLYDKNKLSELLSSI
jgi:HJR/Mrr/RecB family endonuclease